MLEAAVVLLRLAQFSGAMILFGSPLFLLNALPGQGAGSRAGLGWPRGLLAWSAGLLLAASLAGLIAQTAVLAGSLEEGLKPESLAAVMGSTFLGPSSVVRAGAAALALLALFRLPSGVCLFRICALVGAVACASLAWMGHGAADEGAGGLLHLVADILHALAAGGWIGALVVFFGLLRRSTDDVEANRALHGALRGFAGVGSGLVAILLATGLANSWFLVGPGRLSGLWTTAYGQLLSLKLVLFAGMLGLAAANRFRLTPALGGAIDRGGARSDALASLKRSLMIETTLAFAILALVAWFGRLAPVSAQ